MNLRKTFAFAILIWVATAAALPEARAQTRAARQALHTAAVRAQAVDASRMRYLQLLIRQESRGLRQANTLLARQDRIAARTVVLSHLAASSPQLARLAHQRTQSLQAQAAREQVTLVAAEQQVSRSETGVQQTLAQLAGSGTSNPQIAARLAQLDSAIASLHTQSQTLSTQAAGRSAATQVFP